MARPTKLTPHRRERLLCRLRAGESIAAASKRLGVSRQAVHRLARQDPAFADQLDAARQVGGCLRGVAPRRPPDPTLELLDRAQRRLMAYCNETPTPDGQTT
ncbi:hypothetical protein [Botrimarina sp.]|uniref:hypothetical protein n=1 Tax=Botrimarina sp. TaxID=2795802 RepID=UPI0032EE3BCF